MLCSQESVRTTTVPKREGAEGVGGRRIEADGGMWRASPSKVACAPEPTARVGNVHRAQTLNQVHRESGCYLLDATMQSGEGTISRLTERT